MTLHLGNQTITLKKLAIKWYVIKAAWGDHLPPKNAHHGPEAANSILIKKHLEFRCQSKGDESFDESQHVKHETDVEFLGRNISKHTHTIWKKMQQTKNISQPWPGFF